jgi:hypothetical protein
MKKIKITTISIVAVLICFGASTITGAVELDGSIDVEIEHFYFGMVYPRICVENQSIELEVEVDTVDNQTTYRVNDTIEIDLDINDMTEREGWTLPRSIIYSVVIVRRLSLRELFPLRGLINRAFPYMKLFGTVNLVNSTKGSNQSDKIILKLNYVVPRDQKPIFKGKKLGFLDDPDYPITRENLTMYITMLGFLPGEVNGVGDQAFLKIVSHKKIALDVVYDIPSSPL